MYLVLQSNDLNEAFWPVVNPTDNQIAVLVGMLVSKKIAAGILEFNSDLLPSVSLGIKTLGGTVGKGAMNGFHVETKALAEQTEKKNNAKFVNRGTE